KTIKTGGAFPAADPHGGYCFIDKASAPGSPAVQPVQVPAIWGSKGEVATVGEFSLKVPVFFNAKDLSNVVLPIEGLRIVATTLSSDHNCIGKYNAAEFSPINNCLPDSTTTPPQTYFTQGGALLGHILLEAADAVVEPTTNQSLCVLLSKDA